MGPTSSGKTTIAEALVTHWRAAGTTAIHFDGDEVRDFFAGRLGFEAEDRLRVVRTLAHLAGKTAAAGVATIVSALTAHEDARRLIATSINRLIVGYVECPIEICIERDPKGLYARARAGELTTVIGFNSPYVPPERPRLAVNTSRQSVGESVDVITRQLRAEGYAI